MYNIDEDIARQAMEMNSFSDYKEGSATEEFNEYLSRFDNGVDGLVLQHKDNVNAEVEQLISYYRDCYAKKVSNAINKLNRIEAQMPSVMISGAGNFNWKKKEKQNNARDKFWQENGQWFNATDNYYFNKIRTILTNNVIRSNDALAIEKIEAKIDKLTTMQEFMKKANEWYRKNGTMVGFDDLTEESAKNMDKLIENSWYKIPYASFELTNNNANIRRLKERIEELKSLKERASEEKQKYISVEGIEVSEDPEDMRIRIIFDEIPNQEKRELLKHWGFKWSPRNEAWQRQLTANGIYATKVVLEKLKDMK